MRRISRAVGEIELDLGRYELRRRGRRVNLERKPMELLIFLVSRREQLVSRKDWLDRRIGTCPVTALIVQVTDSRGLVWTNWTAKSLSLTLAI